MYLHIEMLLLFEVVNLDSKALFGYNRVKVNSVGFNNPKDKNSLDTRIECLVD